MPERSNYQKVAGAIQYLSNGFKKQPSVDQIARHMDMSPFHFQRIFKEWAGVSPEKFLQYVTIEELKKDLLLTNNLIDATEKARLSDQQHVYNLYVKIGEITPHESRTGGEGVRIDYGFHETPFGKCFIANTEKGICSLNFIDDNTDTVFKDFSDRWYGAEIKENHESTGSVISKIFDESVAKKQFKVLIKGTPFQIKVWEAILNIPFGTVVTYQHIAGAIQNPAATRAVGTAIGCNQIAFLIPCHRVIRSEGTISNYRWGTDRKLAMIGWEKAMAESAES